MTEPVSRAIGTIRRLRNRSTSLPSSRRTTRPLREARPAAKPCLTSRWRRPSRGRRRIPEAECVDGVRRSARARSEDSRECGPPAAMSSCSRKYAAAISCILSSASRSAALSRPASVVSSSGIGNAEALRELSHRVGEADLLLQLDELEHVAANAAAETVKKAAIAIDVERRRLLTVKRTQAFVAVARLPQRHVVGDDGDDVSGVADFVDERLREKRHGQSTVVQSTVYSLSGNRFSSRPASCCRPSTVDRSLLQLHDRGAAAALLLRRACRTSRRADASSDRPPALSAVARCHGRGRCGSRGCR